MQENPTQTLSEKSASITYEELFIFAEGFAKRVAGEKCCAVCCSSQLAAAMAILGCFAAGVTVVPVSLRYGDAHLKRIFELVSPTCVITDEGGEFGIYRISDSKYKEPICHPALIMCTSGTTGTPKGVMLSETNIMADITGIRDYFAITPSDIMLIARPLYHCAVLTGEFLYGLICGVKMEFYSDTFNPVRIIALLKEKNISVFCATPTVMTVIGRLMRGKGNSLRHIAISGECMDRRTGIMIAKSFPHARIYHVYGLTEAAPRVAYMPPDQFENYPDSVGIPLKNVQIKIISDKGKDVTDTGEKGVLWVFGENVMLGYYNAAELTDNVLQGGWLCTGDIARADKNGFIKIYGRADDMIIRGGMNIYPGEIEGELRRDSRVKEILAYGFNDKRGNVHIGIDICGDFTSEDEVRMMCKKLLPPYEMPKMIRIFEELEKNASGKIIRRKMQDGKRI